MAIAEQELERLRSFRRAARQVRDASIIAQGRTIEIHTAPGDPGYVGIFVKLLEDEPFRSLAVAVRLVYMNNEPSSFLRICNTLHKHGGREYREPVADIRRRFKDTLRASENGFHPDDGLEPDHYTAEEVFETWLHGVVFHQDESRRVHVDRLLAWGPHFTWRVQSMALQLAGRTLDLDDVVADFLGEPRLPRIVASASDPSAT